MAERTRKKYNKDCEFVIPNDEDSDLYYETAFKNIVGNAVQAFDKEEEWKYIESNIDSEMICTPKVRHIWRCIFLWAKQEEKTKRTRQNSKSML